MRKTVFAFLIVVPCALSSRQPAEALPHSPALEFKVPDEDIHGLKSVRVEARILPGALETTGQIAFDPRRVATISSRVQGRIEEVKASLWDTVTKGQPILKLYSPDFMTAEAEYLQAENLARSPDLAGTSAWMAKAAKRKLELLGMDDADITELKNPSPDVWIRAPLGGIVLQEQAVRGAAINPGDALYQVGTLNKVWLTADVYEDEIGRIATGEELAAVTDAYPGMIFRGQISRVSPDIDAGTHTEQIRCEVDNPGLKLKPGMLARVNIAVKPTWAVVVPQKALVFDDDSFYAFVETKPGFFERRAVQVAQWNERGYARVVSGLKSGEKIALDSLTLNALWHKSRGENY